MDCEYKGIIAALTTPFENEKLDLEAFKQNIRKYNDTELSGYVIAGSTGEGAYLSDEECIALIRTAKEVSSEYKKIIAGTARESVVNTVELTNQAADAGADSALVCTPHYYKSKMTSEALKKYYVSVAENSQIPLIIYNIPQNTGVSVDQELVSFLLKHPNIQGIKDSSGDLNFFEELIPHIHSTKSFLLGAGNLMVPGLIMGAAGGILRLACVLPKLCTHLHTLFEQKQWDQARKLQLDLVPLNQAVTKKWGIPAAKYALDLLDYNGGPCRLPLLSLTPLAKDEIKKMLQQLNQL
ncbi:MAG: dihydrodipicolinate synthase family protein [Candidatus Aminicenantes bacterium]|nr:dihydrodipicolinate synthase family protein [Candidatus Aminicenantes bacterium]